MVRFAVVLCIAGFLIAGVPILVALYYRDSLTREYSELRRARRMAAVVMRRKSRDLRKHRKVVGELDRGERSLFAELEKRQAAIRTDFDRRRSVAARELTAIDNKLGAIDKQRQHEFGRRLTAVQRSFVQSYLSSARLGSSSIPGVGRQLIANLQAVGIASAGDFSGVSYIQGGRYVTAYFQRSRGGRVHVQGIGQVKAQAIEQWRRSQVNGAHLHQPTTLPADEIRAIEASFAPSISTLGDQRRQVEARVNAEMAALQPELDKALASADDEHRLRGEALTVRKAEVGTRLGQAQIEYLAARGWRPTSHGSSAVLPIRHSAVRGLPELARNGERPREISRTHFSAVGLPRGAHVLLVDDTWASGGHAQSAALALREAGAARVSVLVVARWLKHDFAHNETFVRELASREYDPLLCPWTRGQCP
jgi:phosphoribosylpyrophosphate synthetase